MKDVKNFFKTIKSMWDNPRLKGVVQLIFWIIFFAIVAILFRSGKSSDVVNNKSDNNSINENNSSVVSYEYEYKYTDDSSIVNITGTHYNNKEKFSLNGTSYYSVDGMYYDAVTKTNTTINYAINEWTYNNIKTITDTNPYSNLTKFKAGIEKYEYNLTKEIYNQYYGTNYPNDLIITINKSGNIITDASINYGFGIVNIKYTSINEIESLDINNN